MPSFGHLDKTAHLFVHLTRPAPNSGPLRNLLPGISSYPQKLRPGGTLFFGTAKSRDRNLDRVPDQGGFRSTLNASGDDDAEAEDYDDDDDDADDDDEEEDFITADDTATVAVVGIVKMYI